MERPDYTNHIRGLIRGLEEALDDIEELEDSSEIYHASGSRWLRIQYARRRAERYNELNKAAKGIAFQAESYFERVCDLMEKECSR